MVNKKYIEIHLWRLSDLNHQCFHLQLILQHHVRQIAVSLITQWRTGVSLLSIKRREKEKRPVIVTHRTCHNFCPSFINDITKTQGSTSLILKHDFYNIPHLTSSGVNPWENELHHITIKEGRCYQLKAEQHVLQPVNLFSQLPDQTNVGILHQIPKQTQRLTKMF